MDHNKVDLENVMMRNPRTLRNVFHKFHLGHWRWDYFNGSLKGVVK